MRLAVGSAFTFTLAIACPPFADAVMVALPPATAVTGIGTLVCPEAKLTLADTVATDVLLLETLSVPEAVGAGESAAANK